MSGEFNFALILRLNFIELGDFCRGRQGVGAALWLRVLLPQVLGSEEAAAVGGGGTDAPVPRLGGAQSVAALDCFDLALTPGGEISVEQFK